MAKTKIEWATHSWNPVTGCTPVSEGCQNCYAQRMAKRLAGRYGYPKDEPFRVMWHQERLDQPLRWRRKSRIFVCSMGDLFHEEVPDGFIHSVLQCIDVSFKHIFLLLTKRPSRMKEIIEDWYAWKTPDGEEGITLPKNLWLGVTAENQVTADERIPTLLQIPATVRFVSVEPMLGPVDLLSNDYLGGCINCEVCLDNPKTCINRDQNRKIDWIICGGETGPGARPMHPDWVRSLRDQCQEASVPFFFKSWGEFEYLRQGAKNGDGKIVAHKVGKKRAGRLLDGREWNEVSSNI